MVDARKLLDQILGGRGGAGAAGAGDAMQQVGGLLGAVLGQSIQGVKEGASDIEKRTGVGAKASDAIKGATGKDPGDMIKQVAELAGKNKVATGAAVGGVAALLLGTRFGRGVAGNAATLGGLALIGGLAYKAFQNHKAGKPLVDLGKGVEKAPDASPFGETGDHAHDQANAMLMLRAMIAAAASDGVITNEERSRIVGSLEEAGLDTHSAKFLDAEFAAPASAAALASAATSEALKMQVYTAARVAIDPDMAGEKAFLADLAARLGLDAKEIAQLEAAIHSA
jgi:uncharacterized membrane protein YebE (DUF533 family)